MYANITQRWYFLPVCSGVLLILSFHPYNVWPLAFVALVPLYYFVATRAASPWRIFFGGAITGGLFAFSLSYFTVIQFHWLPEAYVFANAVRLSVIPISLISAVLTGLSVSLYRYLRSDSLVLNALVGTMVYTVAELLLWKLFGGYYLGMFAYAATPLPFLMSAAALGGASLVSFCIVWINSLAAEALAALAAPARGQAGHTNLRIVRPVAYSLLALACVLVPNYIYLHRPAAPIGIVSAAIIQTGERRGVTFGTLSSRGVFEFPGVEALFAEAASSSPDLLIYPFSPVEGALYRTAAPTFNKPVLVASEEAFGSWTVLHAPASTTVMTWNPLYAGGKFLNVYEFWQSGSVVSQYQKRDLFPFMDYTPLWAQQWGLFTTPFDVVAGEQGNRAMLSLSADGSSLPVGSLMCSELHRADLSRQEAKHSPFIIAVGSEAMFQDDVASQYSLKAAQFRAVENNIPVIRGNILGPSALIRADGTITAYMPSGKSGVVRGTLELRHYPPTLYSYTGGWPLEALLAVILLCALWYIKRPDGKTIKSRRIS